MTQIITTYDLARAAARDAANRSMRRAGRQQWSEEDYNEACRELERLWPQLSETTVEQQSE